MIAAAITIGKWLLAFLRSPMGQIVAVCLVFGSLAWWHGETRFAQGVDHERGAWELRQELSAKAARAVEAKNAEAAQRVGKAVEAKAAEIASNTATIIHEVPRYVTPADDRRCVVPDGFRSVHDAAASARLPEPSDAPGSVDDAAAGPALSAVAEVVASNYGACNAAITQLQGWQDWARATGLAK